MWDFDEDKIIIYKRQLRDVQDAVTGTERGHHTSLRDTIF